MTPQDADHKIITPQATIISALKVDGRRIGDTSPRRRLTQNTHRAEHILGMDEENRGMLQKIDGD